LAVSPALWEGLSFARVMWSEFDILKARGRKDGRGTQFVLEWAVVVCFTDYVFWKTAF